MNGSSQPSARPIVHIGYHKTATTWFQERLYPAVRNAAFVNRRTVRQALILPNAFDFDPKAARHEIEAAAVGRRFILCEENLSGYLHNGGLGGLLSAAVAERLHRAIPDARIVVFIREQASAVAASYAQYVRSGGTRSAAAYFSSQRELSGARSQWYKVPLFDLDHFRYAPLLDRYAGLFGQEAVDVFLYEDFRRDQQAFTTRFCEQLNLSVALGSVDFAARNRSLSLAGMRLMRQLNRFTRKSVIDKDVLLHVKGWYVARWRLARALLGSRLERSTTAEEILGGETVKRIRAHFAESNRQIAARWQLPLSEFGYAVGSEARREPGESADWRRSRSASARAAE